MTRREVPVMPARRFSHSESTQKFWLRICEDVRSDKNVRRKRGWKSGRKRGRLRGRCSALPIVEFCNGQQTLTHSLHAASPHDQSASSFYSHAIRQREVIAPNTFYNPTHSTQPSRTSAHKQFNFPSHLPVTMLSLSKRKQDQQYRMLLK